MKFSAVEFFYACKNFKQRALAGTVAADQTDSLTCFDRKVGVIEKRLIAPGQMAFHHRHKTHKPASSALSVN